VAAIIEQGFVLHTVAWRETSLVVELFTRDHGRIAVMAKGARRPRSALRAVLLQFQPIDVAFSGRNELKTLIRAEWRAGVPLPQGRALLIGFYLNELLMRLLAREDPHPRLYDGYVAALEAFDAGRGGAAGARRTDQSVAGDLTPTANEPVGTDSLAGGAAPDRPAGRPVAAGEQPAGPAEALHEPALRRFEWLLLQEIGYAPDLARDRDGRPIDPAGHYRIVAGEWLAVEEPTLQSPPADVYSGNALRCMADGRYDGPGVLGQAKRLSRQVLAEHLEGAALSTRRILVDLQRIEQR
jgi:DNA repair protein RecO (recombination protein O)